MVNGVIVDYLKENKDRYSLEELKGKVLSRGYTENDFDAALSVANASSRALLPKPINSSLGEPSHGIKWMKIAGIIGSIFLVLTIVSMFFTIFIDSQNPPEFLKSLSNSYIFLGVFVFMGLLYLLGFVRMGKLTKVNLLKNASRLRIIFSALFVIMGAVISFTSKSLKNTPGLMIVEEVPPAATLPAWMIILFGIIFLSLVFVWYLFAIGLMRAGRDVGFARKAGIANLIIAILFTLFTLLGIISVLVPSVGLVILPGVFSLLFSRNSTSILYVLSLISYFLPKLFEVLSLMDASKKLER